jgi:hypothetical protein
MSPRITGNFCAGPDLVSNRVKALILKNVKILLA